MQTVHEIIKQDANCSCPKCEESRFIRRIESLLPEAEADELSSWYSALCNTEESRSMSLHHLQDSLEKAIETVEELRGGTED